MKSSVTFANAISLICNFRFSIKLKSRSSGPSNCSVLILNCDEDRSQFRNKEIVIKRFLELIKNALLIPKERKPTKIPKSVIRKRIKDKKNISEIKKTRRKPDF